MHMIEFGLGAIKVPQDLHRPGSLGEINMKSDLMELAVCNEIEIIFTQKRKKKSQCNSASVQLQMSYFSKDC